MSENPPFHLPHELKLIKAQIAERLGSCSSFDRLAQLMPAIVESLWQQAQSAYLDNPIPSQFKHTLFTYLSRFCTVPYCVAWHAAGLVAPNLLADAGDLTRVSAEEVVTLLQRSAPAAAEIDEHLVRLSKIDQSCDDWPPIGTALEQSVFDCAVSIYLRDPTGPRCQAELRRVLGPIWCDRLLLFLSFIRTTHFWAETHGDLPLEPELAALLREHQVLADWLQTYRQVVRQELRGRWPTDEDQQPQSGEMLRIQIRAMRATHNGILITDARAPDNPIIFCNPAAEAITGYRQDEIVGRNCRFLAGGDLQQPARDQLRRAVAEGTECEVVLRNYRKDGSMFWNELTISPVKDERDRVTHFIGIQNDVTDRVVMEDQLERERHEFRMLADNVPEMFCYIDSTYSYRFVNRRYEEFYGRPREDFLGRTMREVLGADVFDRTMYRHLREALGGQRVVFESTMVSFDNQPRWISTVLIPDLDAQGIAQGVFALCSDLTVIKQSIEESRKSEERWQMALRATNEAMWDWDLSSGTVWLSEAYRAQFGHPGEDEDPYQWWADRIHPEDRQRVADSLHAFSAGRGQGERWVSEYRRQLIDGEYAHVINRAIRSYGSNDRPVRILGVMANQTLRKALEKEALDISAAEHRRVGIDLHNGIGQELTGMSMIADSLVLALERKGLPERKIAGKLATGIQRALGEVRILARDVNPVDIDAHGLMSALTEMTRRVENLYGIQCVFQCDRPLLVCDNHAATQLYRIAQEAVSNSLKHGQTKSITVALTRRGEDALLSITDDGIGVSDDWRSDHSLAMQIMSYRAGVIGSQLRVSVIHEKGTELTCTIPRRVIDD